MIDPTTYGLGILFAAWLDLAGWGLVAFGVAEVIGGLIAIVYLIVTWGGVTLGPDPEIPPVDPPAAPVIRSPSPPANYRRPDSDTGVVPRIPGATPEAGPVCPFCGGPWHALCPSAPKERSDETVEMWMATEPEPSPVKPALAPQYAALSRFFGAVDEARADTEQAMRRLAANARPDCPLTTAEIQIEPADPPEYRAASERLGDTRELSAVMKKVSAP